MASCSYLDFFSEVSLEKEGKTKRLWLLTDWLGWLSQAAAALILNVSSPVDDVSSWRGDVDRVQNGPQYLAKRSGDKKNKDSE